MTMAAPQGNDATSMATAGVGDSDDSGGSKSSGTTMTETIGDKDYRRRQ